MAKILLLLCFEHLRHRPVRALLTLIGVAIGVSAWLAIRVVNGEVYASFENSVESVVGEASVKVSGDDRDLDERLLRTIQRHPGVQSASPILRIEGEIQDGALSGRTLLIWGMDLLEQGKSWEGQESSDLLEKEDWENLLAPNTVFLEKELANTLGLNPGANLSVKVAGEIHYLVVGNVLESFGLQGGVQQQVLMDIAAAQWVFGKLGKLHHVEIVPKSNVSVSAFIQELQSAVPENVTVRQSSRRNRHQQDVPRSGSRLDGAARSEDSSITPHFA